MVKYVKYTICSIQLDNFNISNHMSNYHPGGDIGHPRIPEVFLMPLPSLHSQPQGNH